MTKKNDSRSLLMLTGSMFIFGSIGVFRRYIPLGSAFLVFLRGVLGGGFLTCFSAARRRKLDFSIGKKRLMLLILTGAFLGINWMLLFEAYNYTSVATATLCYYMEPVIIILLSPVLFQERLSGKRLLCVICAVTGIALVSGIFETGLPEGTELRGIICGLGAACFYSLVVILNKKTSDIRAEEKTIIQLLSAALVMVPYVMASSGMGDASLNGKVILIILIVGIVHTGIAYLLYIGSMPGLKAQTIAIFSYIDPVTALILSWLVLSEALTISGIIGAVLVLGATFVSEIIKD